MSKPEANPVNDAEKKKENLVDVITCDPYAYLKERPKTLKNILDDIGNTPLVKLNKIPEQENLECDIYVKCEYLNHGGSVKDRIAYQMVVDAEQKGILIPGESVIIEPTSGNTGIGLALVALIKGYKCIVVLPMKNSDEKVNTLVSLGATVIRTPNVPASSPDSDINVAKDLVKKTKGGVMLNQFENPSNIKAHYCGTAEEILWSLDDNLDMVVVGAGTCGTLIGIAEKIKKRCPKCYVVGVDPYGSILAPPLVKLDYEVEGIGDDFCPKLLNNNVVNQWVKTDDKESFQMARRLISEEGILCGGSSGAAMSAAVRMARILNLKSGQRCVVMMPDSIRNYMSKFISNQWMEVRGYMDLHKSNVSWWNEPVSKKWIRQTPSVSHNSTVTEAVSVLKQNHAPLVNVIDDIGALIGVFTADNTRRCLADNSLNNDDGLDKFIVKKYYAVDLAKKPLATLGLVSRMLDIAPFVVVVNTNPSPCVTSIPRPVGAIFSDNFPL